MTYLLDVNALLALAHTRHVNHSEAKRWLVSLPSDAVFATCAITELGFVRVSVLAKLQPDVAVAKIALASLKASGALPFRFLTDDLGADALPAYVKTPAATTDGHLLALAKRHGAMLATFDAGIPGALLIP